MLDNENEKITTQSAGLLTKLSVVSGIIAIIFAFAVMILGISNASFAGSDCFTLALIPLTMAVIFSIGDFIYGILAKAAAQEAEEKILLARRKETVNALDVEEDVRFTAERSLANYTRFAPYVLCVVGAAVCVVLVFVFWDHWHERLLKPLPENSLRAAFVAAVAMGLSAFVGAFFVGQARQAGFRWLRTVGAWFIVTFFTMLLAAVSSVLNHFHIAGADGTLANVLLVIFLILGAEFIVGFIIEFYRPRTIVEERPLFESKILSLFTEPGGVMRNIADTLDYQFGFRVSSTWIYSFIERALYPMLFIWLLIIWLATSIYDVGPNQVGYRVSFGKVQHELLDSGVYFALPWPFGRIETVSCSEIHTVVVGDHGEEEAVEEEEEDDGHGHGHSHGASAPRRDPNAVDTVVTWTMKTGDEAHNHDFVVASPTVAGAETRGMHIALIGISIPVEYRIRREGVFDYVLANRNSEELIQLLAQSVVTEHLARLTVNDVLTGDRRALADDIRTDIQNRTDAAQLGVEIVNVNIQHIHPPMGGDVIKKFEAIYIAQETARIDELSAQTYYNRTVPEAETAYAVTVAEAEDYRAQVTYEAAADSIRFNKQLSAYEAMPAIFRLRSYLDFLENDCAHLRKYIISGSIEKEIYDFNFEVSPALNLLDSGVADIAGN